jgi:hypothetical protein
LEDKKQRKAAEAKEEKTRYEEAKKKEERARVRQERIEAEKEAQEVQEAKKEAKKWHKAWRRALVARNVRMESRRSRSRLKTPKLQGLGRKLRCTKMNSW